MVTPILCLVSFCLLCWVLMLKMEIGELQRTLTESAADTPEQERVVHRTSTTKGMQSFDIS